MIDLRIDYGKRQRDRADYLHLSRRAYGKYGTDHSRISAERLSDLADFHHTSVDYLSERTDDPRPYPRKRGRECGACDW